MKFTRFRRITAGTLATIAATLLFQASIALAAEQGPWRINFKKCFVEDAGPFGGHYEGIVDGDLGVGTVAFTFASLVPGDVIWQFSGVYTVSFPNGVVISAFAAGIDNLRSGSGHDVLNGVVIAGARFGAQVQVRAQDTDGGACSQGTITVAPSN
jgi:hypothetical protein